MCESGPGPMKEDTAPTDDVTDAICATLRAAIFEGALKPGDKLKEDILAKHFGTSRTVVRGALSMLAQQNLAERRRNHGSFVATPSPAEAKNLLATRRVLEMAVMDTLPGKLGRKEFEALDRAVETERKVHSGTDFLAKKRISGVFDVTLAGFADNDVLLAMLQNVLTRLSLVNALYDREQGCGTGVQQHQTLVAHLKNADFAAARAAMAAHLTEMEGNITFDGGSKDEDDFQAILERMTARA